MVLPLQGFTLCGNSWHPHSVVSTGVHPVLRGAGGRTAWAEALGAERRGWRTGDAQDWGLGGQVPPTEMGTQEKPRPVGEGPGTSR